MPEGDKGQYKSPVYGLRVRNVIIPVRRIGACGSGPPTTTLPGLGGMREAVAAIAHAAGEMPTEVVELNENAAVMSSALRLDDGRFLPAIDYSLNFFS